jgi:hypothetical protein
MLPHLLPQRAAVFRELDVRLRGAMSANRLSGRDGKQCPIETSQGEPD